MKIQLALLTGLCVAGAAFGTPNLVERTMVNEVVYVESPTDTDSNGIPDRIYVSIQRPETTQKLSTLYYISPYAMGGTDSPMHNVDSDLLPQDEPLLAQDANSLLASLTKSARKSQAVSLPDAHQYARINAHSVGTGRSTGCPTVGDMAETLAAKSVIDWLNGRARAFYENGQEAKADWANGKVGMTGVSYDGTLPTMVASTGVEGLKAIVPIAAISSWYDYYRANGLVVNPGGYIGEDADILGIYIARRGACQSEIQRLTQIQGRENGDFTPFWQNRDYVKYAKNIKAATFIIHGQSDWNVKQKHAIQLWEALEGNGTPRRMFLHRGGHGSTGSHNVPNKIQAWFDHFLEGEDNGIEKGPQVEVELPDGTLVVQQEWPNEHAQAQRLYFGADNSLTTTAATSEQVNITDAGKTTRMASLLENPNQRNAGRLIFLTAALDRNMLLTGTARVSLNLSVMNRKAANVTVAVVEYDASGRGKIITRGWADPQNYRDVTRGELLIPGQKYQLTFDLEPKQYRVLAGNKIGILVTSTDYDYTLRPNPGTEIQFNLGSESFIDLQLAANQ